MSLADIRDIAVTVAAFVTVVTALVGLESWKKKLTIKSSFSVAYKLAKSVYLLRNRISDCRHSDISPIEFPDNYNFSSEHSDEEEGQAYGHIYSNRLKRVNTALRAFMMAYIDAEVLLGKTIKEKTDELHSCVMSLEFYIGLYIKNKYSGGSDFGEKESPKTFFKDLPATGDAPEATNATSDAGYYPFVDEGGKNLAKEVYEIIWKSGPENEFTIKIDNAIEEIDSELRPHLSHRWWF